MIEELEKLEAEPGESESLDFADTRIIRLLMKSAEAEKDDALCAALWALSESVQAGGLCVTMEEIPQAEAFLAQANAGRYAAILGSASDPKPLIRRGGRLYFHRHFHAEKTLAEGLLRLLRAGPFAGDLREILAEKSSFVLTEKQRSALAAAVRERVFLLTGGPGTGKTALTAVLLRTLMRWRGLDPTRVKLCAPTGRAAQRLRESLLAGGLDLPVETLHRLLGYHPPSGRFARHAGDPLDADLVLVDEASMADVFILAALVQALSVGASLILVGDADQLPSVAAGSILSELLPDSRGAPLPSATLDRSHRSGQAVLDLAAAVNAGDADGVLRALGGSVSDADLPGVLNGFSETLFFTRRVDGLTYAQWLEKIRHASPEEEEKMLHPLADFLGGARILTCARHGALGCERINRLMRQRLERRFDPEAGSSRRAPGFHGAPLLITRNDSRTGLSNGEVGLWLRRESGLHAYFPRPEKWLRLPAAFLPPQEPAFAVTVHKSQGSECYEALIVLPEAGHRLLSREILYTAVTRARKTARLFASEAALREAVQRRMRRPGGLRDYFLS